MICSFGWGTFIMGHIKERKKGHIKKGRMSNPTPLRYISSFKSSHGIFWDEPLGDAEPHLNPFVVFFLGFDINMPSHEVTLLMHLYTYLSELPLSSIHFYRKFMITQKSSIWVKVEVEFLRLFKIYLETIAGQFLQEK